MRAELRHLIKELRHHFPCTLPVRVSFRTIPFDEGIGYTQKKKKYFLIALPKGETVYCQIMILIHEWAHTRTWDTQVAARSTNCHDLIWGMEHATIWRWYGTSRG